jgi:hypothetical protein
MFMKARDSHATPAPAALDDVPPDANAPAPEVTQQVVQDGAKFSSLMKRDEVTPRETPENVEADARSMPAMPSLARFDKPEKAAPGPALTPPQLRERAMHRKALGLDGATLRKPAKGSHTANVKHEAHDEKQVLAGAGAMPMPVTTSAAPVAIKAESKATGTNAVQQKSAARKSSQPHEAHQVDAQQVSSRQASASHTEASGAPGARSVQHESPHTSKPSSTATPAETEMRPARAATVTVIQHAEKPQARAEQPVASASEPAPTPGSVDPAPPVAKTKSMHTDTDSVDAGEMPEPMQKEEHQEAVQERVAQEVGAQVMAQQVRLNMVNTAPQDSPLVEIIKEL